MGLAGMGACVGFISGNRSACAVVVCRQTERGARFGQLSETVGAAEAAVGVWGLEELVGVVLVYLGAFGLCEGG